MAYRWIGLKGSWKSPRVARNGLRPDIFDRSQRSFVVAIRRPQVLLTGALAATLLLLILTSCTTGPGITKASPTAPIAPSQEMVPAVATAVPTVADTATSAPPDTPVPSPTPAVLIAAGDIAGCETNGDEATAALVEGLPGTIAVLGDSAYPQGTPEQFADCYDPAWGRFQERTRPSVGNHEYLTSGASGYFDYFGLAAGETGLGYYSYDLGTWHIVVLNSLCYEVGGCGRDDPQAQWLASDLLAHPQLCTLAYWHFPRFSSGWQGGTDIVEAYWDLLYQAGAEVVLSGHDHDYERFAPQDPLGRADPEAGIREFVVGTGGFSHYPFPGPPLPNSEVREASTFGVLVLTLSEDRYDWQFVPIAGRTFTDSGSGVCHP